jgi:hypothetical protein
LCNTTATEFGWSTCAYNTSERSYAAIASRGRPSWRSARPARFSAFASLCVSPADRASAMTTLSSSSARSGCRAWFRLGEQAVLGGEPHDGRQVRRLQFEERHRLGGIGSERHHDL